MMKQLDIRQPTAGAPAAQTATTQQPSTPDQVEKLKLAKKERAEPPRANVVRQEDKEPPRRHIEVLLIIRNDGPQ